MKYIVHPAAFDELIEGASFYSSQISEPLGQALISEFERITTMLMQNPELGVKAAAGARRFGMRRFPFSVVYRVFPDHLYIIAIAHHKRRPRYWQNRKLA